MSKEKTVEEPMRVVFLQDYDQRSYIMYLEEDYFLKCCEKTTCKEVLKVYGPKHDIYTFTEKAKEYCPNDNDKTVYNQWSNEDRLYQNRGLNHAKSWWSFGPCNFHCVGFYLFKF